MIRNLLNKSYPNYQYVLKVHTLKGDKSRIPYLLSKRHREGDKKEKKDRKSEYIGAIVINLILLYIFNNLLNWRIYFITNTLNEILWIINLSIIATIIGNALLLLYNPEWFRHVVKIILNIFVFIAVYVLYKVFPFDFNAPFVDWMVAIALILIMIGIAIATMVEFFLLVTGRFD